MSGNPRRPCVFSAGRYTFRRGHLDQRLRRGPTPPSPRAFEALRRRRIDHCSMAGLPPRPRSADTFLESRARSSRAYCRQRRVAAIARTSVLPHRRSLGGLGASLAISVAAYDPGLPNNRDIAMQVVITRRGRMARPGRSGPSRRIWKSGRLWSGSRAGSVRGSCRSRRRRSFPGGPSPGRSRGFLLAADTPAPFCPARLASNAWQQPSSNESSPDCDGSPSRRLSARRASAAAPRRRLRVARA